MNGDSTPGVHQGHLADLAFLVLLEEDFQSLRCIPSLPHEDQPLWSIVNVGERLSRDRSYACLGPGYSRPN